MENTVEHIENKAKFFAQYWGQAIVYESFIGQCVYVNEYLPWDLIQAKFLLLKPISYITDEDAIEVAKLMDWLSPTDRDDFRHIRDELIVKIKYNWVTWVCVDYLRSKSYALPWMGLTVEKLIEYRWVELTQ